MTGNASSMLRRLLLAAPLLLGACAAPPPTAEMPRPVAAVDLSRYAGTWYEVARLPAWFSDSSSVACEDVTATYTPRPDGRIGVLNRCLNALSGDAPRQATAVATPVPGSGNARLRVRFFWPVSGDYWVIGLDPDYRWAVVGGPTRRYLWVLSRTPAMVPEDYARALEAARAQGYDLGRLRPTRQAAAQRTAAR